MTRYSLSALHVATPALVDQVDGCAVCGNNHAFEMPGALLEAAMSGRLIVFAGAGVSTESSLVGATFYQRIAGELGIADPSLPFPSLMSAYVERHGRNQLLQRISERFQYIDSHPELWRYATRFHHTLGTAYFLRHIFTTNWDTYFEDIAAATPIVVSEDYAFWDLPGRKVFKLHGSMNNVGTIVATEADYRQAARKLRRNALGGTLRHMLATSPIVFIGYSFRDDDLNQIIRVLQRDLGDIAPRSWLVTPHGATHRAIPRDRVIPTDGTYFIHKLKEAAVDAGAMRPDSIYPRTLDLQDRVARAHGRTSEVDLRKYPLAIYSLVYQDGLQHLLERVIRLIGSGYYSDRHSTYHLAQNYMAAVRGAIRLRHYVRAAYLDGYAAGLISIAMLDEEMRHLPLFYLPTSRYFTSFWSWRRSLPSHRHVAATKQAIRATSDWRPGLELHHVPYADVQGYVEAAGS
jgi:hypothetical protein